MGNSVVRNFEWRMAKWLWVPPGDMPFSDKKYAQWINLAGKPVIVQVRKLSPPRKKASKKGTKLIEEFYHRGAYSRREVRTRHPRKASLPFRGKGSKVERRSKRSRIRRATE
jgi:hypothetical protein